MQSLARHVLVLVRSVVVRFPCPAVLDVNDVVFDQKISVVNRMFNVPLLPPLPPAPRTCSIRFVRFMVILLHVGFWYIVINGVKQAMRNLQVQLLVVRDVLYEYTVMWLAVVVARGRQTKLI